MIRRTRFAAFASIGATVLLLQATSDRAEAVTQPAHLKGKPALELASGQRVRIEPTINHHRVPASALRVWTNLLMEVGGTWMASWDNATDVPSRMWGKGVHVPGSVKNPDVAAQYTKGFLNRHIGLVAPGASPSDFLMVSNHLDRHGMRTIGYFQYYQGLRVLGGQVSFRFKNDRMFVVGSEALPYVSTRAGAPSISDAAARSAAMAWLAPEANSVKVSAVDGPYVLPLIGNTRVASYRTVMRVEVRTVQPIGRWDVFVDAHSGAAVARKQTLHFATATVNYNVPVRQPGTDRADYPGKNVQHLLGGSPSESDENGVITWTGDQPIELTAKLISSVARIVNDNGAVAELVTTVNPGGTVVWNASEEEEVDAQLNTFIHTRVAKDYVRTFAPDITLLTDQTRATVNINDSCNAFADGETINFFQSSGQCNNTGRLADVIYHEFGHNVHLQNIIPGAGSSDGALGEGQGDYLAATITNDSGMGRGFTRNDNPLRELNPIGSEWTWPDDVGEIHDTGRIFGGTMWDLRTAMIDEYGYDEGVKKTDLLYWAAIQRSANIPASYIEVLAADDDDGDLSNGTPNGCMIAQVFGNHGLRAVSAEVSPLSVETPSQDKYHVAIRLTGLSANCPGDAVSGAKIDWRYRSDNTKNGSVSMTANTDMYEGDIPQAPAGTVVEYQVAVELEGGKKYSFPDNAGDPWYQFFVGEVIELYCNDFEGEDPFANGWTHELTSGEDREGADDWTWGAPMGMGGDPAAAFSGDKVIGNDLGGGNYNGQYQPDKVNNATSPVIDVGKYSDVRLQYWRWLNVEDSFFDKGTIYVNGQMAWRNFNSDQGNASSTHHADKEWRFHDVRLSPHISDGTVQVKFEIESDPGLEMGGWNIDDFCIVAIAGSVCGDGQVTGGERCDDGDANSDTTANACRTNCLVASCGDGVVDDGESCDDGNLIDDDECNATCSNGEETGGCCDAGDPPNGSALLLFFICLIGLLRRRRTA
jgi:cysteine-rich repeat protein